MATDDIHNRAFCPKCNAEVQLQPPDPAVRELVEAASKVVDKMVRVAENYGREWPPDMVRLRKALERMEWKSGGS